MRRYLARERPGDASRGASPKNRGQAKLLLGVKLVLGALLLGFVLHQVNVQSVSAMLSGLRPVPTCLAFACLFMSVLVNAHRWYRVAFSVGGPITLRTSVIGYVESMFFNQILPTSVGGDASRVLRAIGVGTPSGLAICSVLIDRALGLWVVALCLAASTIAVDPALAQSPGYRILGAAAGVILAGSVAAAVGGAWLRPGHLPVWAGAAVALMNAFRACLGLPGVLVLCVDLALTTCLVVASFWFSARALGLDLGWLDAAIVVQGVTLATVLPASIGGWGLREGAAVILMAPLGFASSQATALSILFGLLITALGLVGALVWVLSSYRRRARASGTRALSRPTLRKAS